MQFFEYSVLLIRGESLPILPSVCLHYILLDIVWCLLCELFNVIFIFVSSDPQLYYVCFVVQLS